MNICERPSRSSHKNGSIEKNNGVFKEVLERLKNAKNALYIQLCMGLSDPS